MSNYVVNDMKRYKENRRRGDGTGVEITIPVRGSSLSRHQRAQNCQIKSRFPKEISAISGWCGEYTKTICYNGIYSYNFPLDLRKMKQHTINLLLT